MHNNILCRASLDEEVQFSLEKVEKGRFRSESGSGTSMKETQVFKFPFAVFELKVESPEKYEGMY